MISACPRCRKQVSIPPGMDSAAAVRCPLCEAEYALSESLALAPPELIPVVSAAAWAPSATGKETAIESGTREEEVERGIDGGNEAAAVAERFPAMPAAARLRSHNQKSGLHVLIEVVAGGLAGCLVAYYALAFYFGPQFPRVGLPILPLPFISSITAPPDEGDEAEQPIKPNRPGSMPH